MSFDKYTDLEDHQTSNKKKKKQKPSRQADESLEDDASASGGHRAETNKRGKSPKSRKSSGSCANDGDSEEVSVTEHNTQVDGTRRRKKKKKHMRDGDRRQMEDSLSGDLLASDDHCTISIEDDDLQTTEPTSECEDRAGKSTKKKKKKKKKSLYTSMEETPTNLLETDDGTKTSVKKSLKIKKSERSRDLKDNNEEAPELEPSDTSALGANPKTKKKRSRSHCNASPEDQAPTESSACSDEYGNTYNDDVNPSAAVVSKKRQKHLRQSSDPDESCEYHSQGFSDGEIKKRKRKSNSDTDVQEAPKRKKCNETQDTESFSPFSIRISGNMSSDKSDLEDHQTSSKKKKKQKPSRQVDESLEDDAAASCGHRAETNKRGKSSKSRKSSGSCANDGDSEEVSVTEHNTQVDGTRRRKKKKKRMRDGEDSLSGDLLASDDHNTVSIEDDDLQTTEPTSEYEDRARKSTKKKKKKMKNSLQTSMEETPANLLEDTEPEADYAAEALCDSSSETHQALAGSPACSDGLEDNQNAGDCGTGMSAVDTDGSILSPPKRKRKPTASLCIRDRDLALLEEFFPNVKSLSLSSLQSLIQNELERIKEAKLRGIKFVSGRFNRAEDEQIKKNVEEFLTLTGLESGEMLFHSYRYPDLKRTIEKIKRKFHFRQRIAKGVYHTVQEIYHRGPKIYDTSGAKGRFTDEEVKKLKENWNLLGNKWTAIGALIGRNNISSQLKASQLRSTVNCGLWSIEETNLLISAVKEFVLNSGQKTTEGKNQEPIAIAKHKVYKGIPWVQIEEHVKTRNWTTCKRKWFDLALLRMNDGINPFEGSLGIETNINMINWLHESDAKESGEVKWEELTDEIGNIPPWIAQTKFYRLKRDYVPDFKNLSFSEIMNYLYNKTLPELEAKLEELRFAEGFSPQVLEKRDEFLVSDIFQEHIGLEKKRVDFKKRPKSKRRPRYV